MFLLLGHFCCIGAVDVSSVPDSVFIKFGDDCSERRRLSQISLGKNIEPSYGAPDRFLISFGKRPI